jgi:hypothetical protein
MTRLIVVCSFNSDAFRVLQPSDNLIAEIERIIDVCQSNYPKPEYATILEKALKDGQNKKKKRR